MYTFAPSSKARRSAQTVLWKITEALVRLTAPILSFTADEVWEYLPVVAGREASVHLALFPKPEEVYPEEPENLLAEWARIFIVRNDTLLTLEEARKDKRIGKSLEAGIKIVANYGVLDFLQNHAEELKEILNVSGVEILDGGDGMLHDLTSTRLSGLAGAAAIYAVPAWGTKCNRCWNFMPAVANYGVWESVCTRCHEALTAMGVEPPAGDEVTA
jgi:isoleucyl-tRNA synthetase